MGPLKGVKVIEVGGIGAGPFCAMMLADLGADLIRVDRKGQRPAPVAPKYEVLQRGRRSAVVDVKKAAGVEAILKLVDRADVLFECFRPGVMERLGLGPDVCLKRNPKLVYGRITGWGQDGPLARAAGQRVGGEARWLSPVQSVHRQGARLGSTLPGCRTQGRGTHLR